MNGAVKKTRPPGFVSRNTPSADANGSATCSKTCVQSNRSKRGVAVACASLIVVRSPMILRAVSLTAKRLESYLSVHVFSGLQSGGRSGC